MKVEFLEKFRKDVDRITDNQLRLRLKSCIESFELSVKLSDIPNIKKLTGFKNAYRFKLGDYRLGFFFENNVIELARFVHRKDIYKLFP